MPPHLPGLHLNIPESRYCLRRRLTDSDDFAHAPIDPVVRQFPRLLAARPENKKRCAATPLDSRGLKHKRRGSQTDDDALGLGTELLTTGLAAPPPGHPIRPRLARPGARSSDVVPSGMIPRMNRLGARRGPNDLRYAGLRERRQKQRRFLDHLRRPLR